MHATVAAMKASVSLLRSKLHPHRFLCSAASGAGNESGAVPASRSIFGVVASIFTFILVMFECPCPFDGGACSNFGSPDTDGVIGAVITFGFTQKTFDVVLTFGTTPDFLLGQSFDDGIIFSLAGLTISGNGRLVSFDAKQGQPTEGLPSFAAKKFTLILHHFVPGDLPDDTFKIVQFFFIRWEADSISNTLFLSLGFGFGRISGFGSNLGSS